MANLIQQKRKRSKGTTTKLANQEAGMN